MFVYINLYTKFSIRSYRSQVTVMRKENLYQSPGGHTFLIPVDEGFKVIIIEAINYMFSCYAIKKKSYKLFSKPLAAV